MKRVDGIEVVESFLLKAQQILKDDAFDIRKNFYIMRLRRSYSENNLHTNESTLLELDYEARHVVKEIISLTVENYKETLIDNMPSKKKPFYCFIKKIKGKQVYIKFKISEEKEKQVFCVSFHFVEIDVEDEELPYKKNNKK